MSLLTRRSWITRPIYSLIIIGPKYFELSVIQRIRIPGSCKKVFRVQKAEPCRENCLDSDFLLFLLSTFHSPPPPPPFFSRKDYNQQQKYGSRRNRYLPEIKVLLKLWPGCQNYDFGPDLWPTANSLAVRRIMLLSKLRPGCRNYDFGPDLWPTADSLAVHRIMLLSNRFFDFKLSRDLAGTADGHSSRISGSTDFHLDWLKPSAGQHTQNFSTDFAGGWKPSTSNRDKILHGLQSQRISLACKNPALAK